MKKKNIKILIAIFSITFTISTMYALRENLFDLYRYSKATLSYYGSTGQEVIEIQTRLYKWGYYKDAVDGIYGYKTFTAVKYFQQKNGLVVDGIAGSETLAALGINTGTSYPGSSNYSSNANLIAHVIYAESRGEPYSGQVAVGAVVLNRTRDSRFPRTVSGVIYQPGAFETVSNGQINLSPDSTAYNAANDALNGWDPTYGCIYFWNPSATSGSSWIWTRTILTRIGKHVFAK